MPKPPNVVVLLTDQQRHDSTGIHGNPLELTPTFDRLAREGTWVSQSFTCQPVCGPARSCLQTGRYATATGCWRNGIALPGDAWTLARAFGHAGYSTAYIGKWHLGEHGRIGAVPAEGRGGFEAWLASNVLEFTSSDYQTRLYDHRNEPVDLPGYRVDALSDAAIRVLAGMPLSGQPGGQVRPADKPLLLMVSYLEPHHQNHLDDFPPPLGYRERFSGRWTPPDLAALGGSTHAHLGGYWGMVRRLDESIGRIVDALQSLGMAEDTILLQTSDHACHFKTRNGEYKRSCHDSSLRVPTMLWGGPFTGGGCVSQLVSLTDLAPTLLDACGIAVPEQAQGRSILPLLRRPSRDPRAAEPWPQEVFAQISESCVGRTIRTHRYKYAVTAPDRDGWTHANSDHYAESHLYDLQADPHELTNLVTHAAYADIRAELRQRLIRRMVDAGESAPQITSPPPDGRGRTPTISPP